MAFGKNALSYLKQPRIFQKLSLVQEQKSLNLGPKMLYLGIFGVEF